MQDRVEAQKRAAQGTKQGQGSQTISAERRATVRQIDQQSARDDTMRSCVITSHKTDNSGVKPRHPLAQSDVNHIANQVIPAHQTASVGPPKHQNPQNTSVQKLPSNYLAQAIAVCQAKSGPTHAPIAPITIKAVQAKQPVSIHQSATSHIRKTTSLQIQNPILAQPVQPAIVSEADNETGHHQNSDTSFESLTDMDGLFDAGGEEVEALFRACDGF